VGIFEILDYHDDRSFPNMVVTLEHFRDGIDLYRRKNWDDAIRAFNESLTACPGDFLSKMYVERCEHLKAAPPSDDWDGVWVMQSK
jgi:adenylate cyclase